MWFLLTDRKLKGYKLYGPFPTAAQADQIATKLLNRGYIKNWSVVIAQIPPRIQDGVMTFTATITADPAER